MLTVNSGNILTLIKQNTNLPGVGSKKWEEFIPRDQNLNLHDFNPILDQLVKEYEKSTSVPELEHLLNLYTTLRIQPERDSVIFLDPNDPSRQHPVHPALGPSNIPSGIRPVEIDGALIASGYELDDLYRGSRAYIKYLPAGLYKWKVTDGKVEFVMKEGAGPDGPWEIEHFRFPLSEDDPPARLLFKPRNNPKGAWCALRVTALEDSSNFEARPFIW